jgi:UDP-hydrolysing UDP-N-acetyl-D-glucosamine 2-epimerase
MKSVMRLIKVHPDLELQVIVGGSLVLEKYGKVLENEVVDQFHVDHTINFVIEGETPLTMAKSSGLAVIEFANALGNLKPDVVIVIADRFECLAITMAATYMNIPVAHVEGGEISGSIDESIRHAITKMSHLHFPASQEAAQRIERMGEQPDTIFAVGSTSFDILSELDLDNLSTVRAVQSVTGVGDQVPLVSGKFLTVIQHPVTTEYDQNLSHINETLEAVSGLNIPTIWIWPNMDAGSDGVSKGIRQFRENRAPAHMHFFKSLPIELFGPLLKNTGCLIGNSSSGIRESAFLGTPTVNIGTRQTGRQRGPNVVDAPYARSEIAQAIRHQLEQKQYEPCYIYGDGRAAEKIVPKLAEFDFTVQKRSAY